MEREVKAIVLVALGSFLLFFYVFSSSVGSIYNALKENESANIVADTQVYGTTTTSGESRLVDLKLNNTVTGEGVLELNFPTRTNMAAAEFVFTMDGDLFVLDVVCSPGFLCFDTEEGSTLFVMVLRLPEYADIPLIGTHEVATIVYDKGTSAELTMNEEGIKTSTLMEVGSDINILTPETRFLFIGDYRPE